MKRNNILLFFLSLFFCFLVSCTNKTEFNGKIITVQAKDLSQVITKLKRNSRIIVEGNIRDFTDEYSPKDFYYNVLEKAIKSRKKIFLDFSQTTGSTDYFPSFSGCPNLVGIILPNGLTEIGNSTFNGCENLKSITISESVKKIGKQAFRYCINLDTINLPSEITEIQESTFMACIKIHNLHIPDGVITIGKNAFDQCKSLTNIQIPNSVRIIEPWAFSGTSISTIIIPEGVEEICDHTFYGCKNLSNIKIPNSVKAIGDYAFENCAITEITIPDSVTKIGKHVFENYSIKLQTLKYVDSYGNTIKEFNDSSKIDAFLKGFE